MSRLAPGAAQGQLATRLAYLDAVLDGTVSARVNELLNDNPPKLVAAPKRQDKVSGITVRPVALSGGQA